MSRAIIERAGGILDRRTSRRGFLARVATTGAAVAVAPLHFFLYPDSAHALVPGSCGGGTACNDGYHEFCCSVAGVNDCPSWTYHGGWWKCSSYTGGGLCNAQNARYYIDCHNKTWDQNCNCVCGLGTCNCRRVCCSTFHYGNCHSQRASNPDAIVCRKVVCVNPGTLYEVCSVQGTIANGTCGHQPCTGCL